MKISKNYLLFSILSIFCCLTKAQYQTSDLSFVTKESPAIGLDKITVSPSKILFDMHYYSYNNNDRMMIGDQTYLQFREFDTKRYYIKTRSGVNSYISNVPYNKNTYFTLGFNVPVYELMENQLKKKEYLSDLYLKGEFPLDFINCDDTYRRTNSINYGNCFDVTGLKIKLDIDKWNALYSYGKLESLMIKDEFETSSDYAKRTAPDALSKELNAVISKFTNVCELAFENSINKIKPTLSYDADEKTFTIGYPGAVTAKIRMDVENARRFKEGVLNGSVILKDINVNRLGTGKYLIKDLTFNQSKYENILTNESEGNQAYTATYKRVEQLVKDLQKENGAKALLTASTNNPVYSMIGNEASNAANGQQKTTNETIDFICKYKWFLRRYEGDGKFYTVPKEFQGTFMIFQPNGKLYFYKEGDNENDRPRYDWKLSGDKITMTIHDGSKGTFKFNLTDFIGYKIYLTEQGGEYDGLVYVWEQHKK